MTDRYGKGPTPQEAALGGRIVLRFEDSTGMRRRLLVGHDIFSILADYVEAVDRLMRGTDYLGVERSQDQSETNGLARFEVHSTAHGYPLDFLQGEMLAAMKLIRGKDPVTKWMLLEREHLHQANLGERWNKWVKQHKSEINLEFFGPNSVINDPT